ncbi:hypothetical protein ABEB36_002380 [Hypothenemus hampei]|uniref:GH18 domain-containing protein n=1 Tax=Hypothenemus hampei TaxID=57062 RepID=A0ABD1F5N0_HYPHA
MVLKRVLIVFNIVFLLNCFALIEANDDCVSQKKIVCYYASWSLYRIEEGQFNTEKIDSKLCTNIVYSFVGLNINLEIASLDTNADILNGGFYNMTQLKEQNPCLTVTLALGGWNEGSLKYSIMASNEESRQKFAEQALKFISYYGFDGLDLDWEYPTSRGGIAADKENFVALLKTIKSNFSPWGFKLSIAAGIDEQYYDIPEIVQHVDYVHLMAYDFISSTSNVTGLLAPFSLIKKGIDSWIKDGLPAEKLIMGVPTYARCFNLFATNDHGIGAPVNKTTCGGIWTDQDGFLSYYEVQQFLQTNSCKETVIVDDNVYSWCDDIWITYDNNNTVTTKAKYVIEADLGGVMIWSLDTDDFYGLFGEKYPLVTAIHDTLYPI